MYVVAALEMVLRDSDDTAKLVLRLHSYPSDENQEGYWAPPNLQYCINKTHEASHLPSAIVKEFRDYHDKNKEALRDAVTNFAESFGLRGVRIEEVGDAPQVEIKPSINQPTLTNAFYTIRFSLVEVREHSEINLVDREGRHGFVNIALDKRAEGDELFLGKPLISSLKRLLSDDHHRFRLHQSAIAVGSLATFREESGLVVVADIAGYGRVLRSSYSGLMSTLKDEQVKYQSKILATLERSLTNTGTTQVQTLGDGFVAAYPVKSGVTARVAVERVIKHWTGTVQTLEIEVNGSLARAGNEDRIGSRIAINAGDYAWGRINGLESFSPAFNGPAVVDAARLEQGLSKRMKEYISAGVMPINAHLMAFAPKLSELIADLPSLLGDAGWTEFDVTTLSSKECKFTDIAVYSWFG